MSIEDIIYEAYELGKADELYSIVGKLRKEKPSRHLKELYEQAFEQIK